MRRRGKGVTGNAMVVSSIPNWRNVAWSTATQRALPEKIGGKWGNGVPELLPAEWGAVQREPTIKLYYLLSPILIQQNIF